MDQKVRTFAPLTPQRDLLEGSPERSPEHATTAATETTTLKETQKEVPEPSEDRKREDSPGTDNRVTLTDDEYMALCGAQFCAGGGYLRPQELQ